MKLPPPSIPVLDCGEAVLHERGLFHQEERLEWDAMQRAARGIAEGILEDFLELDAWPAAPRLLVLPGKGHNGADALLAAFEILTRSPGARVDVLDTVPAGAARPLRTRSLHLLASDSGNRVRLLPPDRALELLAIERYDVLIDGVFGMQFKPPPSRETALLIEAVNRAAIRFRAAVDLPSGLCAGMAESAPVIRADFTYATGSVKAPLLEPAGLRLAGRIRPLDLGFFPSPPPGTQAPTARHTQCVLPDAIRLLSGLRRSGLDKVAAGHVVILAGSRRYPGTAMLATLGALHGGAGLVTTCLPESLHAAFAAQAPEAMWTAMPETEAGGIALEGRAALLSHLARAHAVVIGPGLGREPETLALAAEVVSRCEVPLILDADALMPEVVHKLAGRRHPTVLTPHAGEWKRIAADVARIAGRSGDAAMDADFLQDVHGLALTLLLKGNPATLHHPGLPRMLIPFGGPVLARGGHGDLLAGLLGALLADRELAHTPARTVAAGVTWAGRAAERMARTLGQRAAPTTAITAHLAPVLRS